jgi:hypothetical protein
VYLRIPENRAGQVQVSFGGSMRTMKARAHDGTGIDGGAVIEVIETMDDVLVVKRK